VARRAAHDAALTDRCGARAASPGLSPARPPATDRGPPARPAARARIGAAPAHRAPARAPPAAAGRDRPAHDADARRADIAHATIPRTAPCDPPRIRVLARSVAPVKSSAIAPSSTVPIARPRPVSPYRRHFNTRRDVVQASTRKTSRRPLAAADGPAPPRCGAPPFRAGTCPAAGPPALPRRTRPPPGPDHRSVTPAPACAVHAVRPDRSTAPSGALGVQR